MYVVSTMVQFILEHNVHMFLISLALISIGIIFGAVERNSLIGDMSGPPTTEDPELYRARLHYLQEFKKWLGILERFCLAPAIGITFYAWINDERYTEIYCRFILFLAFVWLNGIMLSDRQTYHVTCYAALAICVICHIGY